MFLVTWSLGWLAVAGSMWSHPVPVVLDNLFAVSNLLFVLFLVTIMSFGDDILEYLQFKFHLSTSVEIELKRTAARTATLRNLKKLSDQVIKFVWPIGSVINKHIIDLLYSLLYM